jgi:hypothetical protein
MTETILNNIKAKLTNIDDSFNPVLTGMILGITNFISQEMNRENDGLESKARTEIFTSTPILLTHNPVSEISKIEKFKAGEWVEITGDKLFSEKTGKVVINQRVDIRNKIKVSYIGGIDLGAYNDIRELIERLVIRQWNKIDNEGKKTTSLKETTIS